MSESVALALGMGWRSELPCTAVVVAVSMSRTERTRKATTAGAKDASANPGEGGKRSKSSQWFLSVGPSCARAVAHGERCKETLGPRRAR